MRVGVRGGVLSNNMQENLASLSRNFTINLCEKQPLKTGI